MSSKTSNRKSHTIEVFGVKEEEEELKRDPVAYSDFGNLPMFRKIPADKPYGRVVIIELPEGEYEFYSWWGSNGKGIMRPKEEFSLRFKVIAGKAVYLGNLHFWFQGHQWKMKVTDMRERDLPLLYQKNPSITPDLVVHDILQ